MIVAGGAPVKYLIRFAAALLGVLVFQSVFAQPAFAQPYPSRPLHIIIPFATGGVTDIVARTLAPVITEQMGQPVVVDNRPGGASIIGMRCSRSAASPRDHAFTMLPILFGHARHRKAFLEAGVNLPTIKCPAGRRRFRVVVQP